MTTGGDVPGEADVQVLVAEVTRRLRDRGERITTARRAVLHVLAEGDAHLTAEVVHGRVAERGLTAHRASVYRNLDALCELGLVQRVPAAGGCAYHLVRRGRPHPHAQCGRCGVVQDLPVDALDDVADALAVRTGFRVDPGRTALPGLCATCTGTSLLPRPTTTPGRT
jgi:Fur family transcriptional regulator, ferric uptake regulator